MHRKLLLTTAAFASLSLLAACGRGEETGAAPDQQNEAVNQAQDAASAVVGPTSAATLGSTTVEGFVTNAAIGDMYEIESSQMALKRTQSAGVRKLAQMIINDHTASTTKLKSLVGGGQVQGAALPTEMDERRKGMIDNLRGATDQDFDARYLDQQANAHREALTLMNGYQTAGQNEQLKAFASEVAPKIEAHLNMVNELDRDTGADNQAASNTTR